MTTELPLAIPRDHPAFAGHFPEDAIVPGVVLLDEALQAITAHLGLTVGGCTIVSAKFLSPVRPGDAVLLAFERRAGERVQLELRCGAREIANAVVELAPDTSPG